ncbi:MAG: hypothetical protein OEP95_10790 [Myxococcales bacterium]|nr:hypothetical protein [Myxococcales bacterium]
MSESSDLTDLVRDTVDRGATVAEEIHQGVADLPVTLLETLGFDDDTTGQIRRIQTESITAVYDLVRNVNHKVVGFGRDLLEQARPDPS